MNMSTQKMNVLGTTLATSQAFSSHSRPGRWAAADALGGALCVNSCSYLAVDMMSFSSCAHTGMRLCGSSWRCERPRLGGRCRYALAPRTWGRWRGENRYRMARRRLEQLRRDSRQGAVVRHGERGLALVASSRLHFRRPHVYFDMSEGGCGASCIHHHRSTPTRYSMVATKSTNKAIRK